MGSAAGLADSSQRVEIKLSAAGLKNTDTFSLSDPFCVCYIYHNGMAPPKGRRARAQFKKAQGKYGEVGWVELGRTETIDDNLSPQWVSSLMMDYYFEDEQKLRFAVYDRDHDTKSSLSAHDMLGQAQTTVGHIMAAPGGVVVLALTKPKKRGNYGKLRIVGELCNGAQDHFYCQLKAAKLDKKDFGLFAKSDPFFTIERLDADGAHSLAHKSEVIKQNLNPTWKKFDTSMQKLCGNDPDRQIKVTVTDWDSTGRHDEIGYFITSVTGLLEKTGGAGSFALVNDKKKRKKGRRYKNSGTVTVMFAQVKTVFSLLEYIKGGMKVGVQVAIDFTGSNGDPNQPGTLHYFDPRGRPNQYQAAIDSINVRLHFIQPMQPYVFVIVHIITHVHIK